MHRYITDTHLHAEINTWHTCVPGTCTCTQPPGIPTLNMHAPHPRKKKKSYNSQTLSLGSKNEYLPSKNLINENAKLNKMPSLILVQEIQYL